MMTRCCSTVAAMAGLRPRSVLAGACAVLLAACGQAPRVVPVESLAFPVVLITGSSPRDSAAHSADVEPNARELGLMRVERYLSLGDPELSDPPIVIDSNARIFDMTEIKGQHGSLWMMVNPTGLMPITFTLTERKDQGLEAARALIAACEFLGRDLDSERRAARVERLGKAQSMAEIVAIVQEWPPQEPAT